MEIAPRRTIGMIVLTIKPSKTDGSKSSVSCTDPQVSLDNLSCGLCIEISQFFEVVRSATSSFRVIDELIELGKTS